MSLVIRRARESELDEIARVVSAAYEQYRSILRDHDAPHVRDAIDRYLRDVADVRGRAAEEGVEVFVARLHERVVGTGTLYTPGGARTYAERLGTTTSWPDDWAGLRVLAVDPSLRGRGIGRALIEARVQRASALGATAVALHTSRELIAAHRLVNQLGFERVPEFDHHPIPEIHAEAYVRRT